MTLQEEIDDYIKRHRKECYNETDMRMMALFVGLWEQHKKVKIMRKRTLIMAIVDHVLGHKYYANVVYKNGTDEKGGLCEFIFWNKAEAEQHREGLRESRTFRYLETVSFRSRREY